MDENECGWVLRFGEAISNSQHSIQHVAWDPRFMASRYDHVIILSWALAHFHISSIAGVIFNYIY